MPPAPDTFPSPRLKILRPWLGYLLLVLILWPGIMRLPRPASIELLDAPSMALDYAVRHGISLGEGLATATGPLGALLTEVHSGQLLWLNYWCQSLVSLGFALGLSWVVLRTPGAARAWLGGGLFLVAGFRPEYLHFTLLLMSGILLISRPVHWLEAAGIGFILGLLALINAHYAGFALAAVALSLICARPSGAQRAPWLAGATLGAVLFFGWVWSGQPAGDLPAWFWHGVVSAPLRHQATAALWSQSALACGVAIWALILVLLAGSVAAAAQRGRALALTGFFFAVLGHVWRRATGQPDVMPQTFFATTLMASLLWLTLRPAGTDRAPLRWLAVGTMAAASLGLLTVEPRMLTESVILLNQKIVANFTALGDRRGWQNTLNRSFHDSAQLFALPRIKAATAGQSTDFLGNAIGYAFLNGIHYAPRPGLQSYLVAKRSLAERDAAYYAGATAPAFVVQRLNAFDRGLPALEDAPAQLALYAQYDFQFEENGFVLWQHRPSSTAPLTSTASVRHITALYAQPVALPVQPGHAYWISIRTSHSLTGWLKNLLLPPADPTLQLRDEDGSVLSYRAAPAALATGFLLNPLFRGEIDLIRYEAGERLPSIREITLLPPDGRTGDFRGEVEISLQEAVAPVVSGRKESAADFAQRFRIANRLPVAVTAYLPPQTTTLEQKDVLLAHPDSSLEFPVRASDRQLQGRFGLLAGAYQNGNATDGVEFVIEYVPANGRPAILWHRHLDPLAEPGDRGLQDFSVALPQPASGRVILHTQNLPGHNTAWDWSLWTDLRFEPSPASK